MILPLFIRTLSEFFCFSREVSSSGLYGRRSSPQSRYFLIINIHNIAAKVRAVELAGGKICDPSGILAMDTLTWPQRTPIFFSLKPQKNGNRDPSSVAVSCSKKRGLGVARFRRPSVRVRQNPSSVSRTKPSRPTTAGAASTAPRHPGPHPRQQSPTVNRHGGEEKQQRHGGLLGTKLKD